MKTSRAPSSRNLLTWASFLLLALAACDGPESPQAKQEWSVLQGVEYENRSKPLHEPVVLEWQGFQVLGAPSRSSNGNVWVLLRSKAESYYKQMPAHVEYKVPALLIERLEREGRVSEQVAQGLRKGGV